MAGASSKLLSHLRRYTIRRSSPSLVNPGRPVSSPKLIQGHLLPSSVSGWPPCAQSSFRFNRFFSASSSDENSEPFGIGESTTVSELRDRTSSGLNGVADEVFSSVIDEGSILPVSALISLLDRYHDLTGLPWSVGSYLLSAGLLIFSD